MQIAIVDADQGAAQAVRSVEFVSVMHFDQRVHSPMDRRIFEFGGQSVVDGCHDDQDAIGSKRTRFRDLPRIVEEILAQDGKEAKRLIAEGGAKLDDTPVSDAGLMIGADALPVKLSAGRKRHARVVVES